MSRALLVLAAVLAAPSVWAQAPAISSDRAPVEIGLGLSGVRVFDIDFLDPEPFGPAADVRLTVPLTPRFSFETNVMLLHESTAFQRRFRGLYSVLIKQRLVRASSDTTEVFLAYGGTGSFSHVSSDLFAGEAYTEFEPPYASTVGIGFQRAVARHLAVRADAQLLTVLYLPLGVRIAGGVSIPFGSY